MPELVLSEREERLAVERFARMPVWVHRLVRALRINERRWYLGAIALFDARPPGYDPDAAPVHEEELDQLALSESEPTWADWHSARTSRELPPDAVELRDRFRS